jgi:paraquat-inducible protein B
VLLQVQLDYLANKVTAHVAGYLKALIKQEIRPMVDVVADLAAQVDSTLSVLNGLLATVAADVEALKNIPVIPDNTQALEDQIAKLKVGTDAAVAAAAALANPTGAAASGEAPPAA